MQVGSFYDGTWANCYAGGFDGNICPGPFDYHQTVDQTFTITGQTTFKIELWDADGATSQSGDEHLLEVTLVVRTASTTKTYEGWPDWIGMENQGNTYDFTEDAWGYYADADVVWGDNTKHEGEIQFNNMYLHIQISPNQSGGGGGCPTYPIC